MNIRPLRAAIALLVVFALAGCAAQPTDEELMADRLCDRGETLTCDNFGGEEKHCFCADRAQLRRMMETLSTY